MGVDREDFSDADPIAFDAAQAAEGISAAAFCHAQAVREAARKV